LLGALLVLEVALVSIGAAMGLISAAISVGVGAAPVTSRSELAASGTIGAAALASRALNITDRLGSSLAAVGAGVDLLQHGHHVLLAVSGLLGALLMLEIALVAIRAAMGLISAAGGLGIRAASVAT
jgi:hypothetical protein